MAGSTLSSTIPPRWPLRPAPAARGASDISTERTSASLPPTRAGAAGRGAAAPLGPPAAGGGYCIACGERLEPGHRFCWACGAERWRPPAAQQPQAAGRPPPSPGTPALIPSVPVPRAPTAEATPVPGLAWLYGGGAVVWLLSLAQLGGFLAASKGRAQLLVQGGLGQRLRQGWVRVHGVRELGGRHPLVHGQNAFGDQVGGAGTHDGDAQHIALRIGDHLDQTVGFAEHQGPAQGGEGEAAD